MAIGHAVERLIAVVAPQDSREGVHIVFAAGRTWLTSDDLRLSDLLALPSQGTDLFGDDMVTLYHLFVSPVAMIDYLAHVKEVIQGCADGAFGKGLSLGGPVSLGVQGLGQGPKGVFAHGVPSEESH